MRILIADDNQVLAGLLARGLGSEQDSTTIAPDGEEALRFFEEWEPDLVVLDLDLPKRGGMEVLAAMRERSPLCPILILSGSADAVTRTACLEAGADDCLQKPFSLSELRARCRSLLRRAEASRVSMVPTGVLAHGSLELDRIARRAAVCGLPLLLTNREFAILEQLLLARRSLVSRSALSSAVWGSRMIEGNGVDVHVAALRRKLNALPGAPGIETVRGAGFRLSAALPPPIASAYTPEYACA